MLVSDQVAELPETKRFVHESQSQQITGGTKQLIYLIYHCIS